jgi:predicted DNA-binding transcriptional regulator YafY
MTERVVGTRSLSQGCQEKRVDVMRPTRTQRLIRLVQMLQSGRRCDVQVMADEMKVSRRTVFRDIQVLNEAGIGVTYDETGETYRIEHGQYLRPVDLSLEEALSLMMLTRKFVDERVVPMSLSAIAAGMKIESCLPDDIREYCGHILDGVEVCGVRASDVDSVTDLLLRIEKSIMARTKLNIRYDSYFEKQEVDIVLRPYIAFFRNRGWYVVGYSEFHGEPRNFKIERIVSLSETEETFTRPRDFDLDRYFGNAWNMVRGDRPFHVQIHFSSRVSGNVEEVAWHKTQRTRRRTDGTLVFEVDVDGLDEISWWVLGYGDQAIVAEPDALRQLVTSHAKRMLVYYETDVTMPIART